MSSIISWVQARELRAEINEQFRLKHPHLHPSLTLSKIRKIKQLLLEVTTQLDLGTLDRSVRQSLHRLWPGYSVCL